MEKRVREIRQRIIALRINMFKAEAVIRDQIGHDEDCSLVAEELLHMRAAMSEMIRARAALGDREPIQVEGYFIPPRAQPNAGQVKRHPVIRPKRQEVA